jgi:hypothetical protein
VSNEVISAAWLRPELGTELTADQRYPRYDALKNELQEMVRATEECCGTMPIRIAGMRYSQLLIADGQPIDVTKILHESFVAFTGPERLVYDLDIAWHEPGDIDYRIELERRHAPLDGESESAEPTEFVTVHTSAGSFVGAGPAAEVLDEVHDRLQINFKKVIAAATLQEWGLSNGN